MTKIGITSSHFEWPEAEDNRVRLQHYSNAVKDAGARDEFLWIPRDEEYAHYAAQVVKQIDGLLISGGADLPPSMYGEKPKVDSHIELIRPQRPAWEAALVGEFVRHDKPILGICYGCQFLNVWRGGSLIQDIPTEWPDPIHHSSGRHDVHLETNSQLHNIIGSDEFVVESSHHQAVARLAPTAKIAATAPDGVAEAIEFTDDDFMIGVQWHPERFPESLATRRLFTAFIGACSTGGEGEKQMDE
ncbi:MAG TPA: gamma-glutamyl-gamma-aminobutyrate hydrolase family protein [Abditibacteriaceae bacterium]|nr:gamma-glutamyl-gamma-aminobutyrate hydrolase family protein [Abditibacteriaceae bacterium]